MNIFFIILILLGNNFSYQFETDVSSIYFFSSTNTETTIGNYSYPYYGNTTRLNSRFSLYNAIFEMKANYILENRVVVKSFLSTDISHSAIEYRVDDIKRDITPSDFSSISPVKLYENLNQLYIKYFTNITETTIGRQIIGWGSGYLYNPSFFLSSYSIDPSYEKEGMDGVRNIFYLPNGNIIDIGLVLGYHGELDKDAVYLRGDFVLKDFIKISPSIIYFRDNIKGGIDINSSIGGSSVWLETGYAIAELDSSNSQYFSAICGFSYLFFKRFLVVVEYLYNESGTNDPSDYISNTRDNPLYEDEGFFLLGKNYLFMNISYDKELLSFNMPAILNIDDPSLYIGLSMDYNVYENVDISLGFFIPYGKPVYFSPLPSYRSEFGMYPKLFYCLFSINDVIHSSSK